MFSFFKTIFSAITSATVSLVASLGLISAPAQLPTNIKIEPVPIVQQQSIDNKKDFPVEPKSEREQPKSTKSATTNTGQSQSMTILIPEPIKPQTLSPNPAPIITPTPVPVPTSVQVLPPTIYVKTLTPSVSPAPTQIEITSVKVTPFLKSADFEWDTNILTNAKVFVSGSDITTIVSQSNSGISTHHVATASSLQANKSYDFKIEAVSTDMLVKIYTGSFKTTTLASIKVVQIGGGAPENLVANDYKINPDGTLAAGSTNPTDNNFVDLMIIVRDDDGKSLRDTEVVITATDPRQNIVLKNTGNVRRIYDEKGNRELISYYPFLYEFRTAGQHIIMFSTNGMSESITFDVK